MKKKRVQRNIEDTKYVDIANKQHYARVFLQYLIALRNIEKHRRPLITPAAMEFALFLLAEFLQKRKIKDVSDFEYVTQDIKTIGIDYSAYITFFTDYDKEIKNGDEIKHKDQSISRILKTLQDAKVIEKFTRTNEKGGESHVIKLSKMIPLYINEHLGL